MFLDQNHHSPAGGTINFRSSLQSPMDLLESCFCVKKRTVSDACAEGDIDYVKRILKNRNDVEKADANGERAVLSAVKSGKVYMTRYLFAIGASTSFVTGNGWSLLHEAVDSGSLNMVEYILNKCPLLRTYSKTRDLMTPLHLAVFNGYVDILRVLLKETPYACVSPRGPGGSTPLMIATKRGEKEMMVDLYRSGSSFFEADDSGINSLTMARESGSLKVVYSLNVCIMDELTGLPKSRPIFIDTVKSVRNQRKKVFFGIR